MKVRHIGKGRTIKSVTVAEVGEATDSQVVDFACEAARENRSSLFGWDISYFDEDGDGKNTVAVVSLHTD